MAEPYTLPPDLPEEILVDIFSRLPTKVVGKCRCLSKNWCTNLSTTQFIDMHCNHKIHLHENHLILKSKDFPLLCTMPSPTTITISVTKKIELEDTCNYASLDGSCKGLVLLSNDHDELYLVNPITRQQLRIPYSHLGGRGRSILCDLGYDIVSKDYKIVRRTFSLNTDDHVIHGRFTKETVIDVYSVKKGIWKIYGSSPYKQIKFLRMDHGSFLHGCIHWLAVSKGSESGSKPVIACFDLADEVFHDILVPPCADRFPEGTFILRGCLCIVEHTRPATVFKLWMMKEYGMVNSWTKIAIWQSENQWDVRETFVSMGDDEVEELLSISFMSNVVMFNVKERRFKDMFVDWDRDWFFGGCTFVDSLVSPIQVAIGGLKFDWKQFQVEMQN